MKKMTKSMAQRINASLMQEAIFIDKPGCGVTKSEWIAKCHSARDLGVALYVQVVRKAKSLDPTFDAPVGTFDTPLIPNV